MGSLVPIGIDEIIEKILKETIEIEILDYQKLESGGEGYTILYVANLEKEQMEILEELGFENIKEDIWIIKGFEIEPDKMRKVLNLYFKKLEEEKWRELIYLRNDVDSIFYKENKAPLFRSTHNSLKIALKWCGKITCDESSFNDFVIDLCKLLLEKIPTILLEKEFVKGIKSLRNAKIAHDSSKIKEIERAEQYLFKLTGTSTLRNWYEFVNAQLKIIDNAIEFLTEIKTKWKETNEKLKNSET